MTVKSEVLDLTSNGHRVTFHNVTDQVKNLLKTVVSKTVFVWFNHHTQLVRSYLRNSPMIVISMATNIC